MTSLGTATLDLRLVTQAFDAQLNRAAAQMRQSLDKAANVDMRLNTSKALEDARKLRADLQKELRAALQLDVSALDLMAGKIQAVTGNLKTVAGELRDAAQKLKEARSGSSGTGTGGGSPPAAPARPALNPYADQLRAWQTELRAGTASVAQFEAGLRTLQATLQADIAALRSLGTLSLEDAQKLNQLKTVLGGVNTDLQRLSQSATQGGVAQLGREMQVAQSQYQRGALGIRDYLREMERSPGTWRPSRRAVSSRCPTRARR